MGGMLLFEIKEYEGIVFDGYFNPTEILGHSFVCKPVYPQLFRRRYRRLNRENHYSNGCGISSPQTMGLKTRIFSC
jgi:hypothetical protein